MLVFALSLALAGLPESKAALVTFDRMKAGAPPDGWQCGVTGAGQPRWVVEPAASAPTAPNVLKQVGEGEFPWCVWPEVTLNDGFVETRLSLISGTDDQAGGVVWRWKDKDDYCLARANAAEGNVTLFQVVNGKRHSVKSIDLEVTLKTWHLLRVEFAGVHATVYFNGKRVLDVDDAQLEGRGASGVWTKADSVTAFDSFATGPKVNLTKTSE